MTYEDQHVLAVTAAVATSKWYRREVLEHPTVPHPYPEMTYTSYAYRDTLRNSE